jgi:hypothetical protein
MKTYRFLYFIFLFFVSFCFVDLQKTYAAACPRQGDAGIYVDPSNGKCYSKTGLGFNTTDASSTVTCGPVLCPGSAQNLPQGNTCIYQDGNGKCWTGYGGSGFAPSVCTYNQPAPTPVTCPSATPLTIRVADSNNNGIPSVPLQIHYADSPPGNTNGNTISATTDTNGNAVVNGSLFVGDHFTITASGPYQYVPNNWAPTSGKVIGNESDLGVEEMDTNWSCGQQLKDGTITTPCLFTVATHTLSGTVFVDGNGNGIKDAGENGYTAGTVTLQAIGQNTGKSYTTTTNAANGTYSFSNSIADIYNVSITVPNGSQATSANPINGIDITTADVANNNFGIGTQGGISGNIFMDADGNGLYASPDTLYTANSTITVTNASNVVVQTMNTSNGSYTTGTTLPPGNYTVSYTSLPTSYYMSYPLNGPPATFSVTVGSSCNTNGANSASCSNGSISNLNFGITNATSWLQSFCGDVRQDTGITNTIPAAPACGTITGAYMMQPDNNVCTNSPGIAFTGNVPANFGQGQASANPSNWVVGGSGSSGTAGSAEVFTPATPKVIHTSYAYMNAKARQSGITPVDLSTKCTLTSCPITNLSHGIYQTNPATPTDVHIAASNLSGNQSYVFLVSGNLYIDGAVKVAQGSTATFSVAGNIYVNQSIGNASASDLTTDIEGFYSTDKSFIVNSTGSCDQRLNIAGSVIVNAGLTGGSFQNSRNLCSANASCPSVSFTQRPDMLLNAPTLIGEESHIWQELVPGTTPAPTPTALPTLPSTPTITPTFTPGPTSTPTPLPTATPTSLPTATPTPAFTPTPTITPKPTPKPTPTPTPCFFFCF